jgi:type II secretory pathway pseudopilin PulG
MSTRRSALRGIALIEVMVALMIFGIAVVALLQIRAQTQHAFNSADDQHTGAWLAELKMNELISQNLPNPEEEDSYELFGSGDFSEIDFRLDQVNLAVNSDWVERPRFSRFEYEWRKELIFIGADFIGSTIDLENWEQPLDDRGQLLDTIDDPREKPAARVVRVTLTVYLPDDGRARPAEGRNEGGLQMINGRPAIRLVTYVDPNILFEADPEEELVPTGGAG